MDFPRTLYKSPGKKKANKGLTYDDLYVKNEEEYNTGLKEGWVDSFYDALHPVETDGKVDWKKLATDAGIEGDDLKKFMKKGLKQRQATLDALKE